MGLIDHNDIVEGNTVHGLKNVTTPTANAIYRGWMIPPGRYADMVQALHERDIVMRTTARHYRDAHHLPSWYNTFEQHTPQSVRTQPPDVGEFVAALATFEHGAVIIKDYSKSLKHNWDEVMYINDITNTDDAVAVMNRFVELRGTSLDTGIVLRRFEHLQPPEQRTWWVNGICVATTAHPDTPNTTTNDTHLNVFGEQVRELAAPFVTADVVRNADTGALRVIEIGDGQVSDRPGSYDAAEFITAITTPAHDAG